MSVRVDTSAARKKFAKDSKRWKRVAKRSARHALKHTAKKTKARVKILMPVDTGLARDTWGDERLKNKPVYAPRGPGPFKGVWSFSEDGMQHEQGGQYYVEFLEQGRSPQAPAGFIESAARKGMRDGVKEYKRYIFKHLR